MSLGSEPRKRKFEVSEEEWLSVLQRVKDLEVKYENNRKLVNRTNHFRRREWRNKEGANGPSRLLGILAKEQDGVKDRVDHVEGRCCFQQEQAYQTKTLQHALEPTEALKGLQTSDPGPWLCLHVHTDHIQDGRQGKAYL